MTAHDLDWHLALHDYNRGVEKAREEYATHPTVTKSYPCATCTGWSYGRGGICLDCMKEEVDGLR